MTILALIQVLRICPALIILTLHNPGVILFQHVSHVMSKDTSPLMTAQKAELESVLTQFDTCFSAKPGNTQLARFSINTSAESPISLKPYHLPLGMEDSFKKERDELLEADIIEPSQGEWAFPAIPVRKKDRVIHIVVDYRRLNSVTKSNPFICLLFKSLSLN